MDPQPNTDLEAQDVSRMFLFTKKLRDEEKELGATGLHQPWFLEMHTLRQLNFIDIHKRLAEYKKKIYEETASMQDVKGLRSLLHDRGIHHSLERQPVAPFISVS